MFQEGIVQGLEEDCEMTGVELYFDEEAVAYYLTKQIIVVGVSGSEMMRLSGFLTEMVWDTVEEGH